MSDANKTTNAKRKDNEMTGNKVKYEWFHNNHHKGDAERLNQIAKEGNTFMNCAFYHYKEGPAPQADLRKEGITATYRAWTGICQHCGHKYDEHYVPVIELRKMFEPCGFPLVPGNTYGAEKMFRTEIIEQVG